MTRTLLAALTIAALTSQNPAPPPPPATDCQETAAALQRLLGSDARLRDWPQLARYRQDNEKLPPPKSGESRVVFMGDSITDIGRGPLRLLRRDQAAVDRGISGQTAADARPLPLTSSI